MDQKEYRYHLDNIKCSDEFKKKMEKALASEPGKTEEYEDSVSSVERIHTSVFKRYAAMAAALVLVCGAAGTVWYRASKDKNDSHIAASNVETTSEATTEAPETTENITGIPEVFNKIEWLTGISQITATFYVDSQGSRSLEINSVLMAPVGKLIQTLEWSKDTDFDYTDYYVLGNTTINEKGQLLIEGEVYRTDSAKELVDTIYEAFSTSSDFTVNDELYYRIARSTEYYTKLNASIDVIYDSPYSENGNIITIDERGELEFTIDADKVTHEHTVIPSAEYTSDGLSGLYDEASHGRLNFDEMWNHSFEPGISYTQLINRVLYKLPINKHTEEFVDKVDLYILSYDNDEIHELVIDPDTGIITEYREYTADKTYISYKLSNIRYTNDNASSSNVNTDNSGNDTAQNIIRQHIPDSETDIRYTAEKLDNAQPFLIVMDGKTGTELKSLLSSCTWSYTSETFEQKNFYTIEDDYGQLMINEKGQLKWEDYTFATTDHVNEIKDTLRGYFECEPDSLDGFRKSIIESVSKYDHFTADGDITFCYDRYITGEINGVKYEDICQYEINAPGAAWNVNKNGTAEFSCNNAELDNGTTTLAAKVSCEKNGVHLTLTEEGKGIDNFDSSAEITTTDDGNAKRVRTFNLTGAPGIETPLPDYQFMVDKALEMIGQCNSNNNYEITEENGIRYLKANVGHFIMGYSCNVDIIIGIDQNGMLVRFSEKNDETTYYDMTLNNITLDP